MRKRELLSLVFMILGTSFFDLLSLHEAINAANINSSSSLSLLSPAAPSTPTKNCSESDATERDGRLEAVVSEADMYFYLVGSETPSSPPHQRRSLLQQGNKISYGALGASRLVCNSGGGNSYGSCLPASSGNKFGSRCRIYQDCRTGPPN